MGTTETESRVMGFTEREDFLAGIFTTWYMTLGGREKPNAQDKKFGRKAAEQSVHSFDFYRQMHYRPAVVPPVAAVA